MRVVTLDSYGPPEVLTFIEAPRPEPGPGQVLLRVRAASVTSADGRIRAARFPPGFGLLGRLMFGWSRPRLRVLGVEVAGEVVAAGVDARFDEGDRVLCYLQAAMGGYAEYVVVGARDVAARIPDDLSFAEAATLSFGGVTALRYLDEWTRVQPGERVLVLGASGAVGSAMVQIARHLGAEVTGVCSARNVGQVRALGAHEVVDYGVSDVLASGRTWDVVVDAVGVATYRSHKGLLTENGRICLAVGGLWDLLSAPLINAPTRHTVVAGDASCKQVHLDRLLGIVADGGYRPWVERTYAFEEVAEAHRYVDTGHKRGNLALELA